MLVELHVFSGRPNPRWELDEPRARRLAELQRALPFTTHTASVAPGLGYSGFGYADADGPVVAYNGHVRTVRGDLDDPKFTVERFLLEHVPDEFQIVKDRIAKQLRRSQR